MMGWTLRVLGSWTKIITANEQMWNDIASTIAAGNKVSSDDVLTGWAKVMLMAFSEFDTYLPTEPGTGVVVLTDPSTDFPVTPPNSNATKVGGTLYSVTKPSATIVVNEAQVTGTIDASLGSANATVAAAAKGTYYGVILATDSAGVSQGPIGFGVYVKA